MENASVSNQYNRELVAEMARLCKPFCSEDNGRLYPLVAAGDPDARQQMIEGNMSLAISKAESFIRCFPEVPHLRDDLISAAFIGLTKAVNKIAAGKGPRKVDPSAPADFIGMWINRELRELMETEGIVPPHTSKARANAKGEELTVPTVVNIVPERFALPSYEKELEARDLIDTCCVDEDERTLFAMREASHTYAEIGLALGKSTTSTYEMARELAARVQRKLEAPRNE